ncbi:MAG: prepilin-type N-terminal cleavage/methylation domain-containing protein [Phycisphaerae bacterium]|nr:prepilin-type N-terminal cleavage/methylation domain-containing protein [Phycisphaerae bacterium]
MRAKSGFTLVEILIVVVILGILAAIVIPQFTDASEQAKESSLVSDLQTMRSQIELYKIQHNGVVPGTGGTVSPEAALTGLTTVSGAVADAPGTGVYGPYLQKLPKNQFTDGRGINGTCEADGSGQGWTLNVTPTDANYGYFNAYDPNDPNHEAL